MAATKECPSCGAQNDVIFTNCMFCKTSLPQSDMNSISNEDLIMNASEWVGRSKERFIEIKGPKANAWIGKDIKRLDHGEIVGNAEKYLSLIAVRAINNPTLGIVYQDLKLKLGKNTKQSFYSLKNPMFTIILIVIIGLIVAIGQHFHIF